MQYFLEIKKDDVVSGERIQNFAYDTIITETLSSSSLGTIILPRKDFPNLDEYISGSPIGDVSYKIENDILTCSSFYPFGGKPEEDSRINFLGRGIATEIEKIITNDLLNYISSNTVYKICESFDSKARKDKLTRLGFNISETYILSKFLDILHSENPTNT